MARGGRGILPPRGVRWRVAAETAIPGDDRLRRLERELRRARRSRQVLMEVLTGVEEAFQAEIRTLEAENRRLRRLLARRRAAARPQPLAAAGPRPD